MKQIIFILGILLYGCQISINTPTGYYTATSTNTMTPTSVIFKTTIIKTSTATATFTSTKTITPTITNIPTKITLTPTPFDNIFNGIRMNYFKLTDNKIYSVGEDIWFEFEIENITDQDIKVSCVGSLVNDYKSQCSWGDFILKSKQILTWKDHTNIYTVGNFKITGGICYGNNRSNCDSVIDLNGFSKLSNWINITIK